MMLLDFILIIAQLVIIKTVAGSDVWGKHCVQSGRFKVVLCGIVLSTVFALLLITGTALHDDINKHQQVFVFTLLVLYSFIEYQVVHILNRLSQQRNVPGAVQ